MNKQNDKQPCKKFKLKYAVTSLILKNSVLKKKLKLNGNKF